jgi:polyferredoxin
MALKFLIIISLFIAVAAFAETAAVSPAAADNKQQTQAAEQFPDFSDYETPPPAVFHNPPSWMLIADPVILTLLLGLGAWMLGRGKSRVFISLPLAAGLLYFGFIKHGCICPVGATGNIVASLTHRDLSTAATSIFMFFIPVVFALFAGRVFCGTVCPLGAVQEFIAVKPLKVPGRIDWYLQFIKYAVLLLTIVFAVKYASSFICRYDPFVTLFRFSGHPGMWIFTGAFLLLCVFVKRPFCRYFCPYGVVLAAFAWVSFRNRRIEQSLCVSCKKCEAVCPVDCVKPPEVANAGCVSCGACAAACPRKAISYRK